MSNYDQLFGKALQTLVTKALLSLNSQDQDKVLVSDLTKTILTDRPDLKDFIKSPQDRRKLNKRVRNCVRQLSKTNLIKIEIEKAKTGHKFFIVYTKI